MPHLKASNSEAPGVMSWSNHRHQEGAVGDVLLVELHGDLVVSCGRQRPRHSTERNQSTASRLCVQLPGS